VSNGGIIIQGNSVGSHVAMHMAAQRRERALAMIISGTGYPPLREPTAQ
jgi:pimeloyl-ACP methyl ester carboxylesterase